jgi:hypothetical protein
VWLTLIVAKEQRMWRRGNNAKDQAALSYGIS